MKHVHVPEWIEFLVGIAPLSLQDSEAVVKSCRNGTPDWAFLPRGGGKVAKETDQRRAYSRIGWSSLFVLIAQTVPIEVKFQAADSFCRWKEPLTRPVK